MLQIKQLTVIVIFLNEKEEVHNTLKSIVETADSNLIDIIVINDASDDGFNYDSITEKFQINYIKLPKRYGIARCRDLAIEKCQTKFFLLLDSHMRFYDKNWVGSIVNTLTNNKNILLCCDNIALQYVEGNIKEIHNIDYYGAVLNLYDKKAGVLLGPLWNKKITENHLQSNLYSIPCVLGAAYACSKEYWEYLQGLKGLELYGFDEPYISLKVWLEGGRCILDKNIRIGHIYRNTEWSTPYSFPHHCYYYNCLLITTLLLPPKLKDYIFHNMKISVPVLFNEALYKLYENRVFLFELKNEYKKILTNDFSVFELMNNANNSFKPSIVNLHKKLEDIANYIVYHHNESNGIGLYEGKIGVSFFLYSYANFSKQKTFEHIADLMLDDIFSSIDENSPVNLYSGYCGIGVGLLLFMKESFVIGDENVVFEFIDKKVEETNIMSLQDINLLYGLGGICLYVLLRLYNGAKIPFSNEFLNNLHTRVKNILQSKECKCDCIDIYIKYLLYIEEKIICSVSISDILFIDYPKKILLKNQKVGLNGLAGLGIKLLLEYAFAKSFSSNITKVSHLI